MPYELTDTQILFDLPGAVRGDQLADEAAQAAGLDAAALKRDVALEPDGRASLPRARYEAHAEAVAAVVAAHVPDPLYFPADVERARQEGAGSTAAEIPGWAGWTVDQAVAWIEANVTDLASAKQALVAMARLLVALRNRAWPHLESSE